MAGVLLVAGCASPPAASDRVSAAAPSTTGSTAAITDASATPDVLLPSAPVPSLSPAPSAPSAPAVSTGPPSTGTSAALPAVPAPPIGLWIPSIEMDEQLIDLGLADDGGAEVPQDYDRAGWYSPGGRPGAVGPTVLLGHVDSTTGPAVFYRLRELAIGDEVQVRTADGGSARYAVVAVDEYGKDDFPTFAVFGATLDDVVRLVTCGGDFDSSVGSYVDNLVVTAARVA